MDFSTHSIYVRLEGQLVINDSAKKFVLLHKLHSLLIDNQHRRDDRRIVLKSIVIALVFNTLMTK